MLRFTIRDVLWLIALVGMGLGWWVDHRVNSAEQLLRHHEERVLQWLAKNSYWVQQTGGRHMERPLPPTMEWKEWTAEGKRIPNVEPTLRKLLEKRDARVELCQIALALGEFGNTDSVSALIDCLSSDSSQLRLEATLALGRLGDKRAVNPLADILVSDSDVNVRANAASGLYRIGGAGVREFLEVAAKDQSEFVSSIAKEHLRDFDQGVRIGRVVP